MIRQYAFHLEKLLGEQGVHDPVIRARTMVGYNYRTPQTMIDPGVNLLEKEYSFFRHADWILPLKE